MSELTEASAEIEPIASTPPRTHIGARAFVGTFGTTLFIQMCNMIQGILVARLLGPVGRGEYAAVLLWPQSFAAISIFGLNIAISRAAAKSPERNALLRSAILFGFATSMIGALICYLAIPWLMPATESHLVNLARLFVLYIPCYHLTQDIIAVDQGVGNFRIFNITRAILNPAYIVFLVLFWFAGHSDLPSFTVALLLASSLPVAVRIASAILNRSQSPIIGKLYSPSTILSQSIRFGLAGMADPVYQQFDNMLMLWLLGTESLGIYAVARAAAGVIGSVTQASGMVTFTIAAQADHREGCHQVAKAFRVSLLLWVILGGALAIVMPWILPLVYGQDFASAVTPARLLIVGFACVGLANQLEQAMRGQGRAFVGLEGRLAGLIVMTALGVALSQHFGLLGGSAACVVGQGTCLLFIFRRTRLHYGGVDRLRDYLPNAGDIKTCWDFLSRQMIKTL